MRLRPARREERQLALLWGVLTLAIIALRPLWLALAPLAPRCPFKMLTGLPCLSCGTTRAAVALLGGDVGAALLLNPLAAAAGIAFLVGGVLAPIWALGGGRVPVIPTPLPRAARVALVAILLLTWIYLVAAGR